jgi:hypothetical protein
MRLLFKFSYSFAFIHSLINLLKVIAMSSLKVVTNEKGEAIGDVLTIIC